MRDLRESRRGSILWECFGVHSVWVVKRGRRLMGGFAGHAVCDLTWTSRPKVLGYLFVLFLGFAFNGDVSGF